MYDSDKTAIIGGAELGSFRIVTPKDANVLETQLAKHLALHLKDNYGYTLTVSDDTLETENEILIGSTSRTTLTAEKNAFAVALKGRKLQLVMDGLRGFEGLFEYAHGTLFTPDTAELSDGFCFCGKAEGSLADGTLLAERTLGNMRVMYYNVYGWSGHGPNGVRHDLQIEMIKAYAPDVLCLQEYGQHEPQVTYHKEFTPLISALGYSDASVETSYINNTPLFYRTDRLTLLKSGCWLYSQPNNANSKSITWAVLEVKATGKRFIAISTHFMYDQLGIDANAARIQNAREMLDIIAKIRSDKELADLPLIMGGDLNCHADTAPHGVLADGKLVRAHAIAQEKNDNCGLHNYPTWSDEAETFTQWVPVGGISTNAIDHAYASPNTEIKVYATVTTLIPLLTSDHMPLIVEIEL